MNFVIPISRDNNSERLSMLNISLYKASYYSTMSESYLFYFVVGAAVDISFLFCCMDSKRIDSIGREERTAQQPL